MKILQISLALVSVISLEAGEQTPKEHNMSSPMDPCVTSQYYTPEYTYSLPENFLKSFLSGNSFDHKEDYSTQEQERVNEDIRSLFNGAMAQNPAGARVAVITAGAPGAGKTMLLEADRQQRAPDFYTDPDAVCLKGMKGTHGEELQQGDSSKEAWKAAYDKWRPASNGAHHILTAQAIMRGLPLSFGTTCASPLTHLFFRHLKAQGYTIRVLHVTAPDQVRVDSVKARDKEFVQTTDEDIRNKGKDVPQRIQDTFLSFADSIEFFYRGNANEDAVLAANWKRGDSDRGDLKVIDKAAYSTMKDIHNQVIEEVNKPELKWEVAVEEQSNVEGL